MALSESDLQKAIFTWAATQTSKWNELKWLHAIPNGGRRDGAEAVSLRAQGVRKGILDIHLPVARGGYYGLMVELKKPVGKCLAPSVEQAEYMEFLTNQGYLAAISNDFDEIKLLISGYLDNKFVRIK